MASSTMILALSDLHGRVDLFKKIIEAEKNIDLILFAGDVTPYGGGDARSLLAEMARASRGLPLIAVPGNVDDPEAYSGVDGLLNIHGRAVKVGELTIVGVGGSPPTPFFTEYELSEDEIEFTLREAIENAGNSEKLAILSHAPPFGTKVDVLTSGENVGSHGVRVVIEEFKPILCVCGHIHEARGVDKLGDTLLVNPGPAMRGYYSVIEISGSTARASLKRV